MAWGQALFGGFAPPAAWQTTAVFFIVVNSFRKKTTFSVKVSTFLVNCQLIQEIDCQLHQEKSNKLSTKIRKRQNEGFKIAKGNYIALTDSDDKMEPQMLYKMVTAGYNHDADIICCNYQQIDEKMEM